MDDDVFHGVPGYSVSKIEGGGLPAGIVWARIADPRWRPKAANSDAVIFMRLAAPGAWTAVPKLQVTFKI